MIESAEKDTEQLTQIHIIGTFFESKTAAVVEIHGKFCRKPFAQNLDRCGHFLFTDFFVFLLLGSSLEALPGEGSAIEVHEDVAEGFHIIPAGLFDSQVSVDAGISCGPS